MPHIRFNHHSYDVHEQESVLDGLTRQGVSLTSSCRSGICQSCMLRAEKGKPPAEAQKGLKESLRERNCFLACVCISTEDMEVSLPNDDDIPHIKARIIGKECLNQDIIRLRMRPMRPFTYRAGQFINLHHQNIVRSYSLASVPGDEDYLELQVQVLPGGMMSGWLERDCVVGNELTIQGPLGDCYYTQADPQQALLLIGTGSGLAPLWGIARDALSQGHQGPIHLFHGSRTAAGLYLRAELEAMTRQRANFHYTACVSGAEGPGHITGRANDVALQRFPQLKNWQVFLCGHPDMVKSTKMKAFLAGAALQDIHADPFEYTAGPAGKTARLSSSDKALSR